MKPLKLNKIVTEWFAGDGDDPDILREDLLSRFQDRHGHWALSHNVDVSYEIDTAIEAAETCELERKRALNWLSMSASMIACGVLIDRYWSDLGDNDQKLVWNVAQSFDDEIVTIFASWKEEAAARENNLSGRRT